MLVLIRNVSLGVLLFSSSAKNTSFSHASFLECGGRRLRPCCPVLAAGASTLKTSACRIGHVPLQALLVLSSSAPVSPRRVAGVIRTLASRPPTVSPCLLLAVCSIAGEMPHSLGGGKRASCGHLLKFLNRNEMHAWGWLRAAKLGRAVLGRAAHGGSNC